MCWFGGRLTRVRRAVATARASLLRGSACPHYSAGPRRAAAPIGELIGAGAIAAGLALDDHVAALYRDGSLVEAVLRRAAQRRLRGQSRPATVA